ncbi:MAG TPA: ATP-binding cassette domain-containing protein [Dongiaceae bacterium]|nr:ATP-binding cassette domain-containing protein [Dongiaceae bacterium]
MIVAENIYRRQGGLAAISADIRVGAITAVLGPNGAGKSTLLDVLAGRSRADSGVVRIDGRRIESWTARDLARKRAFLPQNAEVAFPIGVREVVMLGRAPYRFTPDAALDAPAAETALRLTDTWHLRDRLYQQLSGGERQRVQLARVIAQIWRPPATVSAGSSGMSSAGPRMLLLDEPTASLDPGHRLAVMRLLRDLVREGIGVLIALHDLNDALRFTDDALLLRQGRMRGQGGTAQVIDGQTVTEVYGTSAEVVQLADQPMVIFR